ncbi:MAG: hypothetical protein GF330_02300 [Candidatus Eisenbacteria bacterium]|nr:hypothetical protein [Candidatus Eisenbacteria bacterium]
MRFRGRQLGGHRARIGGLLLALGLSVGFGCGPATAPTPHPPGPSDLPGTLARAEENRGALETVLRHYRERGDSLKLRAARFLIRNMADHGYTVFGLYDSAGVEIELDVLAFPDYETLRTALDSIEASRGEIDYQRKQQFDDVDVITADLLIEQIDLAFTAWQGKPWARHLTFEQFCDYVLPYRGSGEPLERWRGFFLTRYADLPERMEDPTDPVEAARLINDDLRAWFKFDPRFYLHPTDQGLAEMVTNRMGRCEDMTNLTIYAMRANGLGVTSDYTPYWADAGNNHAWNAILDRDGRVVMFMGAEAQPGEYRLSNRVAKVYRKMFAQQPGNLVFQKPPEEDVPRWLGGKSYIDVTSDYTGVADLVMPLEEPVPEGVHFAYVCVFNDGQWKAIDWAPIEGQQARFHDLGTNLVYLPAYYAGGEILPAAPALILEPGGTFRRLLPHHHAPISFPIYSTTQRRQVESSDGVRQVFLEEDREYELFYWEEGWVSMGTQVCFGEPLRFNRVPSGALYWLVARDSRREERIFTLDEGQQVWW